MSPEGTINAVSNVVLGLACFTISFSLMRSWAWLRRAKLPTSLYVLYACFIALLGVASLLDVLADGGEVLRWAAALAKLAAAGTATWTASLSFFFPQKVTPLAEMDTTTQQSRDRILALRRMLEGV